jgi:NAD+ diphosphatase
MPATLSKNSLAFAWRGDKVLVSGTYDKYADTPAPTLPTIEKLSEIGLNGTPHFMGTYEDAPCLAVLLSDTAEAPQGWHFAGLRSLFLRIAEPMLALAARAFQIVEWDRTHRFCGRCGSVTQNKNSERAKECPACGLVAYPRISPAMMVLVTKGRELLLARAHRFPGGMYSALAGFVEPGETIEDCVRREVREEVNVEIAAPAYFASQSWPFPHSLMIAFTAEYKSGDMRASDAEIADAQWFALDALPQLPSPVSIARQLIDSTVARLRR